MTTTVPRRWGSWRWVVAGMALAFGLSAAAADVVVSSVSTGQAVDRVARATDRSAAQMTPLPLDVLLDRGAGVRSAGRVAIQTCKEGRAPATEDLATQVARLEASIAIRIDAYTEEAVNDTFGAVRCLRERVDRAALARLLLVSAAVTAWKGDSGRAFDEIVGAVALDPAVVPSAGAPEALRLLFTDATGPTAVVDGYPVTWVPAIPPEDLLLDGHRVFKLPPTLGPGWHAVQWGLDELETALVWVQGEATLYLVDVMRRTPDRMIDDPVQRAVVVQALADSPLRVTQRFLVSRTAVWRPVRGGGWEQIPEPVLSTRTALVKTRVPLSQALAVSGASVLLAGGVLTAVSDGTARRLDAAGHREQSAAARGRRVAGQVVMGVGVGTLAAGIGVDLGRGGAPTTVSVGGRF